MNKYPHVIIWIIPIEIFIFIVTTVLLSQVRKLFLFRGKWCGDRNTTIIILPNLIRLIRKFSPLYGVFIPSILYRLQQKISPPFFSLVLTPFCLYICRLIQNNLCYLVFLSFLSYTEFVKKCSSFGVLILPLLWRPFQINLFILLFFHDHLWPWGGLRGRWSREKM